MRCVSFKDDIFIQDMWDLTDSCKLLLLEAICWTASRKLSCTITSLNQDRVGIDAVSKTHETGRAFDLRVGGDWSDRDIAALLQYINKKFESIGALSLSDGKPRAVILHNAGSGRHFHFQTRS